MNPTDAPRGELTEGIASSSEEIDAIRAEMQDMQMQIDILKETINVLKKDPGVDQEALRNREKAVIIDALKSKYSLPQLLGALNCSRSSYYYQRQVLCSEDKYRSVREHIKKVFADNHGQYGYRRIHAFLTKEGTRLSEKVVRRLMKQDGLAVSGREEEKI